MIRKLPDSTFESIKDHITRKRKLRERLKGQHFDLRIKNIEHSRQFLTQLMIIAGSLAVFLSSVIDSQVVKISEFFNASFVLLLFIVGFGAWHLKRILEKENNDLEEQRKRYISYFPKFDHAEDRVLAEKSEDALINLVEVEDKGVGLATEISKDVGKPDSSLSVVVWVFCLALFLLALSITLERQTLQHIFQPLFY